MPYDPERHHRRSIRLKGYDYSQAGAYFVTVCTQDREVLLGDIVDEAMRWNAYGDVVAACWDEIPTHFPTVDLDAFVVMPNHVHGVIVLAYTVGARSPRPYHGGETTPGMETGVETMPLRNPTLGQVVAYFKSQSTKRINEIRATPGVPIWQRNYYEHIIRDEHALQRIRDYIATNPLRWALDRENPARLATDDFDRWLDAQGKIPVRRKRP
jgi:putative transposase